MIPAAVWIWYYYLVFHTNHPQISLVPLVVLVPATYAICRLRERHHMATCWLLLACMILTQGLIVAAGLSTMPMAFGVIAIIAANALLGASAAFAVAVLTWLVAVLSLGLTDGGGYALDALALYALTWGATWLAGRPLERSVESALTGWAEARKALLEVRERRAEIYRALRALEEASYRIERMNHELTVARREAEVARALKARFAATVSHELRGPLNLILGFSRLMALSPEKYGEPLPSAYRADVYTIYRSSQHLATLVDDILDLSQVEAERLPLVKDRIDLDTDVIGKVDMIVRPLAERKGLYLHLDLAPGLPSLVADAVRLRQVLLNLLNNAVRYTDHGGITVRTALCGSEVLVSVQDSGRGIAANDMPHLFEEFRQLGTTEPAESKGSGLGLAISRQLVELHGGRMWAESEPGAGATFCFTLPLAGTVPASPPLVRTADVARGGAAGETCLFVHDDLDLVRLLARHIEGYRVVGVPSAQEVPALVEALHPRAIVTTPDLAADVESLLAKTPFDPPLITCGLPSKQGRNRAEGVLSYLIKPILPEALTLAMRPVEREGETTVLLVDDDPGTVQLVERSLTALPRPYRILKAHDGLQALELMRETVPDVVLLDLIMPGLDGWETIARMRADPRTRKVPVVIVSGQDWAEEGMVLATPIAIRRRQPVDLASAARCLQAWLAAVRPTYLPAPTVS